eukprot:TRINITY_DN23707_c0_g1_i1.p1 TRINITY_DN23707_c0_g1~~TRINITY_DN23707_c0_g1_i1.p1  ORF type:complete len:326 (+),score=69.31 TRINITY_DN23707_c0_g1_i1:135-1112(+)
MATRNRTAAFLKYREAVRQSKPFQSSSIELSDLSSQKLIMGGVSSSTRGGGYNSLSTSDTDGYRPNALAPSLPPAWVDISEEVSAEMAKARGKMAELAKAHSRALMPTFDDSGGEEHNIEVLTHEITRTLKRSEQKLQRLSGGAAGGASEDTNIRKNVQRSMATDLQALSMEFRKQQKGYLERLRRQDEGSAAGGIGMGLSEQRREPDDDFFDPGFNDQQMSRVKGSENIAAEREKEVAQIMQSVNELAQIMKDLSVLVIDQGTIIDRIDYNIENVAASVEKGVEQLTKAESHQKKGRMVMCIMLLLVVALFLIVVLIVKKIFLG